MRLTKLKKRTMIKYDRNSHSTCLKGFLLKNSSNPASNRFVTRVKYCNPI